MPSPVAVWVEPVRKSGAELGVEVALVLAVVLEGVGLAHDVEGVAVLVVAAGARVVVDRDRATVAIDRARVVHAEVVAQLVRDDSQAVRVAVDVRLVAGLAGARQLRDPAVAAAGGLGRDVQVLVVAAHVVALGLGRLARQRSPSERIAVAVALGDRVPAEHVAVGAHLAGQRQRVRRFLLVVLVDRRAVREHVTANLIGCPRLRVVVLEVEQQHRDLLRPARRRGPRQRLRRRAADPHRVGLQRPPRQVALRGDAPAAAADEVPLRAHAVALAVGGAHVVPVRRAALPEVVGVVGHQRPPERVRGRCRNRTDAEQQ